MNGRGNATFHVGAAAATLGHNLDGGVVVAAAAAASQLLAPLGRGGDTTRAAAAAAVIVAVGGGELAATGEARHNAFTSFNDRSTYSILTL